MPTNPARDLEPGTRVRLIHTADPYTQLKPGDEGTVTKFRRGGFGAYTLSVDWDNGSRLSLLELDTWEVV
jgi:Domain of unknown function (DUF4314)